MGNNRGFSLLELIVTCGVVGVCAAVAIPSMNNAVQRNRVITSAQLVSAQIREARLAAITRNQFFRVAFDCPATGAIRMLEVTGDPAVDDDPGRCTTNLPNDGPPMYMPEGVGFGEAPETLQINSRGQVSVLGGAMPHDAAVTDGALSFTVTVTATGRVTVAADVEE